jgi:DNA replication ATP-dependent helicase Dna2
VTSPVIEILEHQAGFNRERDRGLPPLFDLAILDEAAQITEPMALGAINRATRFVLVGDHQQLPPVVAADRALSAHVLVSARAQDEANAELRRASGVAGLDLSLFERLQGKLPSVRLDRQYRMNQHIAEFSSSAFYDGALDAPKEVAERQLSVCPSVLARLSPALAKVLDPASPLVLVDVAGRERGHRNMDEVEAVMTVLGGLLTDGLLTEAESGEPMALTARCKSIGLISPFRAQVRLLREQIRDRFGDEAAKIEVDTVERFQGGEKEVMLVSFVASGRASSFLADHRRLNVTLTRARSKLVIFGGLDTLSNTSPLLRRLISTPSAMTMTDTQLSSNETPVHPND